MRKQKFVRAVKRISKTSRLMTKNMLRRPRSRPPSRIDRVPVGSMVTADYNPDRVRQYTGPAGNVLYQRRG